MSFHDFCHNFLGLPEDFFSMKLHREGDALAVSKKPKAKSLRPVLPKTTTLPQLEKLFQTRLREKLFNVDGAVVCGLQRASTQDKHMTEDHLFQVMCHHGCMPTRKEITEMMAHFDGNRDGKIDLQELACELLQLPRPSAVSHINPFYSERPPVSAATRRLVQRLSIACERTAAPPSRIYNVFRQFDKDGSGSIAYDEVEMMVRDFGCEVEGRDAAALLLERFTGGKGSMNYIDFITGVIGLQPDALKSDPNSSCPATPQLIQTVSTNLKKQLFNTDSGQKRLLNVFDKDGGGTINIAEFQQGIDELNLPVDRKQINHLFKQFEQAQKVNGEISVIEFTKSLFGMSSARKTSRSHSSLGNSRPLPTSRGGSPCMPKEFRDSRPRTSMSMASSRPKTTVSLGSMRTPGRPAPMQSHRSSPMMGGSAQLDLRAAQSPARLQPISTPSSWQASNPASSRSRVPTHRRENLRREPHCVPVRSFQVTDSGQQHNFSPKLINQLTGAPSRQSTNRSRGGNIRSDVTQLPNFHLSTAFGANHE